MAINSLANANHINNIMTKNIKVKLNEVQKFDKLDPREPTREQHGELVEDLVEIPLFDDELEKTCKIVSTITGQLRSNQIDFLKEYCNVFSCHMMTCQQLTASSLFTILMPNIQRWMVHGDQH